MSSSESAQKTPLSVTIIALNEEKNIARAVKSVLWASEIIVVDCGSKDKTCEVAGSFGARVIKNPWTGFGQQKNFAQNQCLQDWILNLDADEELSPELQTEIRGLLASSPAGINGFALPRKAFYLGRWILHGGWYPNYLVRLSRKTKSRWSEPEVHEELIVEGSTRKLGNPIHHYPFAEFGDQVRANLKYSKLAAEKLIRQGEKFSVLKLIFKPFWKFIHTYFIQLGFLDGFPGFLISVNAGHSMFMRYAFIYESTRHR